MEQIYDIPKATTTTLGKPPLSKALNSTEISSLWKTFMHYSMLTRVFKHFNQVVEDTEIRPVLQEALPIFESRISRIPKILAGENLPIPIGFTDDDFDLGAPRLYTDSFYLYYLINMKRSPFSLIACLLLPPRTL